MFDLTDATWQRLESIVHHDPAGRGLASSRLAGSPLDAGGLQRAAESLAGSATSVAILTGFGVLTPDGGYAAETDGPPGALFLARTLSALGCNVTLLAEAFITPVLELGCQRLGLSGSRKPGVGTVAIEVISLDLSDSWSEAFFATGPGKELTHLVAIERPGPSHTLESLRAQSRGGRALEAEFLAAVPAEHRNVCHTMRGLPIDDHTAPAHRLFETIAARKLPVTTIGILDGGNEIGGGSIPWETLCQAIGRGPAPRVACRIAVDHLLIAGVSNWGAYALAMAVAALRGQGEAASLYQESQERELLAAIVRETGAVDGMSGLPEPRVDGLASDDYFSVLARIQKVFEPR